MLASGPLLNALSFRCQSAFEYLYNFKGVHFLVEFYEIEHLQSIEDAVDDFVVCCQNNGGTLR